MDIFFKPFSQLYLELFCLDCQKELVIGLSESVQKNGFRCPFCDYITCPDEMWEVYLSMREDETEE